MNQTEFTDHIQTVLNKVAELVRNKNTRYSDDADAFSNLELCENAGVCSVERGIMVRMFDKMGRISNLLGETYSHSEIDVEESITDSLMDLIGYAAILVVYRKSKELD